VQDRTLFETILGIKAPWHERHAAMFATLPQSQGRPRVGDQRSLAHPLDLPPVRGGEAIFYSLVQLGRPSRLDPVKAVAATLKRHLDEVLRFVEVSITNGVAEELNSQIMRVKPNAGGFRNARNFTTAIYFHCGGLDLYPR
jgi:hypothetical protein